LNISVALRFIRLSGFAESKPGAIIGNAPASVKHKNAAGQSESTNLPAGGFEKIMNPWRHLEFAFSENWIKVVVLLLRVTQQVRQIYTSS
jgi:hypothetical protein